MKLLVVLLLMLLPCFAAAQQKNQYDSIKDAKTAIDLLHNAVNKSPQKAIYFCQLAERKNEIQQYDSAIFYANHCIALLLKDKNNLLAARVLHAKGIAQYYLDDKVHAEENWRSALQLAKEENDALRTIKLATNLGAVYLDAVYLQRKKINNFIIADSFFSIAYQQLNKSHLIGSEQGLKTLRLMATSLQFQKKHDSANILYRQIIALSKGKYETSYLGALSFYAESLSETGHHKEAFAAIKEAADYIALHPIASKDKTHIMHIYARVLFYAGNFKGAYQFIDSSYNLLADDYQKINAKAYAESESKFKNQLLQYQIQLEKQEKNKLYFIIAGIVLLVALLFLFLKNKSNKRIALEKATQKQISIDAFIEGEEKEKVRIGRELHDGIAQEIVAIKLAMQQQQANPKLIAELKRIGDDIRTISHELMPQTLKDYGLKIAIEDICQKILGPSGIRYEIIAALPEHRLPDKIEITLYRVFQELVHNIIKHSEATEVLVQLRKMSNHILLVVEDNGKGMLNKKNHGIGISNLKSRVQLLDGNLEYDSSEEEGTTAIVRVPC